MAQPETPRKAEADQGHVRERAAYYLASGLATDTAEALQMALDYHWGDVEDERSLLGKQEKELARIRAEAQANQKKP